MLSREALTRIDRELTKYPADQKGSAVLAALAIAQGENAGRLTPQIAVEEVASFYTMYDLAPVGRHKICLCTNLPCALQGATEAAAHLHKRLGIGWNETTPDGRFTLKEGECFGACGDAPVMLVNNKRMVSFMTPEAIDKLLRELE